MSSERDSLILDVRALGVRFPVRRGALARVSGWVHAVQDVSLQVRRGKTLGLVGESGCGKTTLGRAILRLVPASSGEVFFDGVNLFTLDARRLRAIRRRMQVIFQDPVGSLNPRLRIETIVGEALTVHGLARGRVRREHVARLLDRVGLDPSFAEHYAHELSGGQRQRVGIARALALSPEFIVCDEPVSALDVSIQSQILNLLRDLQAEMGLSYLFIAHNLAVIKHFCNDVAVMYLGRIVEQAPAEEIYRHPRHPYTQALLSAVPEPDPQADRSRVVLTGEVPSPLDPPSGCAFHPRCPLATDECRQSRPVLTAPEGCRPGHLAACHRADEIASDALLRAAQAD